MRAMLWAALLFLFVLFFLFILVEIFVPPSVFSFRVSSFSSMAIFILALF